MSQIPQEPQPKGKQPATQRRWLWVLVVIVVIFLLSQCMGGGDEKPATTPAPAPAPTTTKAPPTQPPTTTEPPKGTAPTGDEVGAYVAKKFGGDTPDAACLAGTSWLCNIERVEVHNDSQLQIHLSKAEIDPDRIARNWYINLEPTLMTSSKDSPMPKISYVQVTSNAADTGSFMKGRDQ
ncbi:MAG: hypothetical protein Q4G46_00135 [Propionibacteriaceae bacterium]|nr:hypothetical protein [Propionibacteriaceae bacterium]